MQKLIPPVIVTNRSQCCIEFHSFRPWVIANYEEDPVPWTRILVYSTNHSDQTYQVLYNSSFYIHADKLFELRVAEYIILMMAKRSGVEWTISKIKLYDYMEGRYSGRIEIPVQDKCIHISASSDTPLVTVDMVTIAFRCRLQRSNQISLTIYNACQKYENNEVVFTLLHKNTMIISDERQQFFFFRFLIGREAAIMFVFLHSLKWCFYHNIHQSLTINETIVMSVRDKLIYLDINQKDGIILGQFQSSQPLCGFEISCFPKTPLCSKGKIVPVRQIYLEIYLPSKDERDQIKCVILDEMLNILQLHHYKDRQGNYVYDVVNVYSRIFQ
jgi:hypothetical protein